MPLGFTIALTVKVCVAPFAKFPMLQTPVTLLYVPVDGDALINVYPEGNISSTSTKVAVSGPLFLAVKVKIIVVPIIGLRLLATFVTDKSVLIKVFVLFVVTGLEKAPTTVPN